MRTNVVSLKIEKSYREAVYDWQKDRVLLTIMIGNKHMITGEDSYKPGELYRWAPMWHSQKSIDNLIAQLRGKVDVDDLVAFDDVSYMVITGKKSVGHIMKAGYDGFEIWKMEGGKVRIQYFTFPGSILADKIERLYVSKEYKEASYEFSPEQLATIKCRWWPRARLEFTNYEVRDTFMRCFVGREWDKEARCYGEPGNFPEHWQEKNVVELRRNIRSLMQIARNYSDGDPAVVHLSHDIRHSFYWWIENANGNRVMNGGLIAHRYEDKETGDIYFEYSTHT